MIILITTSSILFFSLTAFILRKYLNLKICPLCVGVSLTWLWMLIGIWFGILSVEKYQLITAVLMGGSIIGIVNKLGEKKKMFIGSRNVGVESVSEKNVEKLKDQMENCC